MANGLLTCVFEDVEDSIFRCRCLYCNAEILCDDGDQQDLDKAVEFSKVHVKCHPDYKEPAA